uniref:Ig-like domain-containing protein n=1 Tax=Castor canadensis TaxID=51338 RepID=A0A8C0ZP64_CASCN
INMFFVTCSVFVIFLMFRRSSGDSVTQTEGPVTLTEGTPMFLNCTYQITFSISFTFWYVQYLHEAPQLLLKSSTESQRTENKGFQATLVKSNSSFHLQKSSLLLSDSAVYYCAVRDTVRGAAGGAGLCTVRKKKNLEWEEYGMEQVQDHASNRFTLLEI